MRKRLLRSRQVAWWALLLAAVFTVPYVIPERPIVPVADASARDWHPRSFWYEPWGRSGVHKGIDIFAPHGRAVVAPTDGLVIYRGYVARGGNVVLMLGPKWRLHYFAHLASIEVTRGEFLRQATRLGSVGDTGNAAGKPPHLHYAVLSLWPRPWAYSSAPQGWKQLFFIDPGKLIGPR